MSRGIANKNLLCYLGSRFFATVAMQMQFVAIGWQVYEITRRPLDLGLIGLVQFLPMALLSIPGGQLADHAERRKIILVCQSVLILCFGVLFGFSRTGSLTTPIIYSLLVIVGMMRAFWAPAIQSFLPHLVPKEQLPRAVAWNSSTWQIAVIAGPSFGGLLYAWSGKPSTVYFACILFMAVAVVLTSLIGVRTKRTAAAPISRKTLLAGIRYVRSQRVLLGAISLDLFAVLLGGAVALLPAYARDILMVGPAGLGLLRSAPSIGATCMGIYLGFRPLRSRIGPRLFSCVFAFGILTIVFGLSTNFVLSLFCLILLGAFDLVGIVVRHSLIQLRTPDEMRGRVSAVALVFVGASNELGEFESGITAAWFGLVPAVVLGGVGTCLIVALGAWFFPELRNLQQFIEPEPARKPAP
ncbi:MAG: MFS transporter [Pseudomonadota bacterium]